VVDDDDDNDDGGGGHHDDRELLKIYYRRGVARQLRQATVNTPKRRQTRTPFGVSEEPSHVVS
jgi:hypothetical protein